MNHGITKLNKFVTLFVTSMLIFLLLVGTAAPATADSAYDGRINIIPWVNSWGAIAVYCVDANGGHASYTGGYIQVLTASGQRVLKVSEATINRVGVNPEKTLLIQAGPLYKLWRLPDGEFLLTSRPDIEGKTFIGKWHDCTPIGPASGAPPVQSSLCSGTITLDSSGNTNWSTVDIVPGSVSLSSSDSNSVWQNGGPWADSGSDVLNSCSQQTLVTVTLTAQCKAGGTLKITSAPVFTNVC
jgi:hypothetical protein